MKYMILFLFAGIIQSCKKFVEVDPPIDKLTAEVVFNNDVTATSALLGIYANMMASTSPTITTGGISVYAGLSADELYNSNISDATAAEFLENSLLPNNSVLFTDFWFKGYNIIYHVNACVEGLENNTDLSVPLKNQLLGEAIFT
ncbi:MAG TPA: RagB/SusD family nutrient uptake outer membrane protein, partial [Candidatus Dojkabacteria bacterium]|nr:RagB/SusD family nutrient uptake outer membrane protein [Candidatus Dojkabacteria bacterium]